MIEFAKLLIDWGVRGYGRYAEQWSWGYDLISCDHSEIRNLEQA